MRSVHVPERADLAAAAAGQLKGKIKTGAQQVKRLADAVKNQRAVAKKLSRGGVSVRGDEFLGHDGVFIGQDELDPSLLEEPGTGDAGTAPDPLADLQTDPLANDPKGLDTGGPLTPEEIKAALAEARRAEANYKLLEAGTRSEEIDEAAAKVEEVKARLREVEAHLEEGQVRAPERAVIEVLAVRKGDLVPPQQPVVRVLRADDLWVRAYVPETLLGKVRLNQPVEVTVDSYPGRVFHGTVIQVASESEFTPRNVQSVDERRHQVFGIKVQVPDPQGVFKSGMAAEVKLKLHE